MRFEDAYSKVQPILVKGSNGVCDFGFVGDNHHKAWTGQACHYEVGSGKVDPRTEFYYTTVTPSRDSSRLQAIYDYCMWLLSDDGPYKDICAGRDRTIIVHEGGVAGILLRVEMQDDAALIRNLSMALRLTGEHKPHFDAYEQFRAIGLSEADSFFLANQYADNNGRAHHKGVDNSNHIIVPQPLDFNLKRFTEGNPYFWDKSLDGKKTGDYAAGGYSRTTGCFRERSAIRNMTPIYESPELVAIGHITGRWHKTKAGASFDTVAKHWMDVYKPKFMEKFA